MRVLVVEDQTMLADLVATGLRRESMAVDVAYDGTTAQYRLGLHDYDVVVLDRDLPGVHGDDICAELIGSGSRTKVLMLTAAGSLDDRVDGLELGADDYLTKPFEPKELVLRIQSILKRARPAPAVTPQRRVVKFGPFLFELDRRRLFRGEEPFYLTEAETDLLAQLAARAGEALSRDELTTAPESGESTAGRQVDVLVTRLRRKIEDDPRFPRHLQTVRGRGYMLQPD